MRRRVVRAHDEQTRGQNRVKGTKHRTPCTAQNALDEDRRIINNPSSSAVMRRRVRDQPGSNEIEMSPKTKLSPTIPYE